MRTVAVIIVCLLIAGCDRDVILQVPGPAVGLSVTARPSVGSRVNPVTITAEVVNWGSVPRICHAGCDYPAPGMGFQIFDPSSKEVFLTDPRTRPACPDYSLSFLPREKFTGVMMFDGTLFGSNGDSLVTQEGTYTVIVSFRSWRDFQSAEPSVAMNRTTFRWTTQ
jgi:hypothetical protein